MRILKIIFAIATYDCDQTAARLGCIGFDMTEEAKLELVKSRFENIDDDDLMDGDEFFDSLDNSESNWSHCREAGQSQC
ncbi:hypothetical protein VTH8203_03952 [Vibrio thalassae]|uniref:Uncharacterized protein n=2 Tax=Vibrio thalassae TaxID=1243014 RepID=A0A240ENL9_9VIBR|nr:hypothetical protein VTH8203_03952 [Vibrio thalassae]